MTIPSLLLGFIIATLLGTLFHLWRGGGAGRLLLYLLLSWGGFLTGHLVASFFELTFDKLGPLHIGSASFGSILLLFFGNWLSLVEIERKPNSRKSN
jgi:hypothetical protein